MVGSMYLKISVNCSFLEQSLLSSTKIETKPDYWILLQMILWTFSPIMCNSSFWMMGDVYTAFLGPHVSLSFTISSWLAINFKISRKFPLFDDVIDSCPRNVISCWLQTKRIWNIVFKYCRFLEINWDLAASNLLVIEVPLALFFMYSFQATTACTWVLQRSWHEMIPSFPIAYLQSQKPFFCEGFPASTRLRSEKTAWTTVCCISLPRVLQPTVLLIPFRVETTMLIPFQSGRKIYPGFYWSLFWSSSNICWNVTCHVTWTKLKVTITSIFKFSILWIVMSWITITTQQNNGTTTFIDNDCSGASRIVRKNGIFLQCLCFTPAIVLTDWWSVSLHFARDWLSILTLRVSCFAIFRHMLPLERSLTFDLSIATDIKATPRQHVQIWDGF